MAIKKEILRDSGITTTYHRIKAIVINENLNQCLVTLEEYLDEEHRNTAKDVNNIKNQINELYHKAEHTKDEDTSKALIEKATVLQNSNLDNFKAKFFVKETNIALDYIPEDRTVSGFYNELKKLPEYTNSEEV